MPYKPKNLCFGRTQKLDLFAYGEKGLTANYIYALAALAAEMER
jgi:hypothetical protein